MEKCFFILFPNVICTKGANESLLTDLQKNRFLKIPIILSKILELSKTKEVPEVKSLYKNEIDEGIDKYFDFLIKNDYAFYTSKPELFPPLEINWDVPCQISNIIIDINSGSHLLFEREAIHDIIKQINQIGCKFIEIRIFTKCNIAQVKYLLHTFNCESEVSSFSIVVSNELYSNSSFFKTFSQCFKFKNVLVYGSKKDELDHSIPMVTTIKMTKNLTSEKHCGIINSFSFSPNIPTFMEAQFYNSCLNRKLSIDVEGNIKNCPSIILPIFRTGK